MFHQVSDDQGSPFFLGLSVSGAASAGADAGRAAASASLGSLGLGYGDAKVANRDTRVWHGATDNGP